MQRVVDNVQALAKSLLESGFDLVSGGTKTHLLVIDLRKTPLTGKEAEERLERAGLFANKQLVPRDPKPPTVASGLRMGSPCAASRGMGPSHMRMAALWVKRLLLDNAPPESIKKEVAELARQFPVPGL
jgi:glycine hydroxymethyltransferase